MKTLTDIRNIILKCKEGWTDSKIAEEYHMSRNTVRKYRKQYWDEKDWNYNSGNGNDEENIAKFLSQEPKYDSSNRKPYKYKKEIDEMIESILDDEMQRQKLEGSRFKKTPKTDIHRKIREAGFDIGYTTISKKVDEKRLKRANMMPWAGISSQQN